MFDVLVINALINVIVRGRLGLSQTDGDYDPKNRYIYIVH